MPPAPPALKPERDHESSVLRRRLAQLGMAGFLFFLIKGLLWLIVPTLLVAFGVRC